MKKPGSNTSDQPYEVGYRKPPKANQFRKGRSGNRRAKLCGEENLISVFKRHVSKRVKIRVGDNTKTMTLAEAVILKNLNASLQRNPIAMSNIFRLAENSGEFIDRTDVKQIGLPLLVPVRSKDMREFLAEFGRPPETE